MIDQMKVLIADQAPMRLGIRMALAQDAATFFEAETAEQAIRAASRGQPDVCLVGRSLCGAGMGGLRGICRAAPGAAVVVLAPERDEDDLLDAVRAGAVGYVAGGLDAGALRRIVRSLVDNEAVVPRSMVMELVMELRGGGGGPDGLTGRETQVLGLLRRGHTTATIADRLGIRPVTVRRHISDLVQKLGVGDRAGLMAHAGRREPALAQTDNGLGGIARNA
jgi:two-component system nitrate/nitrite response regulator NarL